MIRSNMSMNLNPKSSGDAIALLGKPSDLSDASTTVSMPLKMTINNKQV